ncbi:hypothetical protein [Tunturiibacter gelidiferens]|uniref:hypothetical protein n=1 Tax=Tunturiibacter gelidiferens TaxID=3069689 RepID=UPI003D9BABE8
MLALSCSVTVTVTVVPVGAVNLTGGGGGGGGSGAAATAGSGAGAGGTAGIPVVGDTAGVTGAVAALDEVGVAGVPSGFWLCVGAGVGAGVELLHPLKSKVAERAKLAARYIDFTGMVFSDSEGSDWRSSLLG